MKLYRKVLTLLIIAALFLSGCPDDESPVNAGNPVKPVTPVKYSREYLGEWIRMDTGERWYITGETITVNGSALNRDVTMSRNRIGSDWGQIVTVKEQGLPDYFLFASRVANGSFKSRVVIIDEGSENRSAGRALIPGGGIKIKPPLNPGLEQTVHPDPDTGEMEVDGIIPGDPVEITPLDSEWSDVTVGITPWDGQDMGIIPLAKGANFKTSIRMANPNDDISVLFADWIANDFIIEIENIGTTNTTGVDYELIMYDKDNNIDFNRDFILYSGNTTDLWNTIRPGEKREIRLSLGATPIEENQRNKKLGLRIVGWDTELRRTKIWDDFVSINYYKVHVPFRFRSEKSVQGVIRAPSGKTFYFKTEGHEGNYSYSIDVPWSNEDYIIAFLGASVETGSETRYSLAINDIAPSNWSSLTGASRFLNEPQNDNESGATNLDMEINRTFMGYLHDGDVDFYRINLGNVMPEAIILDVEDWAFCEASGSNPIGHIKPGDTVSLDILFRNNSTENKTITINSLTVDSKYASYFELVRLPSYQLFLQANHYGTLTSNTTSTVSSGVQLLNNSNINRAFQFKLSPDTPYGSMELTLSFNDNTGVNYIKAVNTTIAFISPTGIEMHWIPAGTFQMDGTDSGGTTRPVTLTSGFFMGKYEVTQAQYKAVMNNANPSYFKGDNLPVEFVVWYDAIVFCNRLSVMEGLIPAYQINGSTNPDNWGTVPTSGNATWNAVEIAVDSTGYRLPTEAQWEYACRAGTTTAFNWGSNTINSTQANYYASYVDSYNTVAGTSLARTAEVGSYAPNNWGLYDMHGNVLEWCWDWYGSYASGAQTDPRGAASGSYRVFRGGSWYYNGQILRSAVRGYSSPHGRGGDIGFRLLRP